MTMKTNFSYLKYFIALAFGIILLNSCSNDTSKGLSEGVIEYEAAAVDPSNSLASFAPNKMTVKFKNDVAKVELSAVMGLFSTTFISNPHDKTLTQLTKLLNKKYAHISDVSEIEKDNELTKDMVIEETNETKVIAGYTCKKAIAKFKDNKKPDFTIYYTDEIKINDPNWINPFYKINGVLMEYQMEKLGLELRFTAKSVKKSELDDDDFDRPKEYQIISREEMEQLLTGI